jgi:hypothetical protein
MIQFLTVLVLLATAISAKQANPGARRSPQAVPPDWEKTSARIRELVFAGKEQEIVGIVQPLVEKYPQFAEGHFWLGSAHENMARALARTDPARALSLFETAATDLRHAFDLGGGEHRDATIRGLIDLYDYALRHPDSWKATILEAVSRFPAEPAAHWYHAQLLLRERRTGDLDGAFRTARAGLPAEPPDARLEYASLLVGLAEKNTAPDSRSKLSAEASALAVETLERHPSDRYGRRAQSIKEEAARLPPK